MIQKFEFEELPLKGSYKITPFLATDERGGLLKDYNVDIFNSNGIKHNLKETFYTITRKGVIRALHFQLIKPQAKLIRCISGHVYAVICDLRKESPTYKKWLPFHLTGDNMTMLYVPGEFGLGYFVIEDAVVSYKCDEVFYGEGDSGIMWNDKDLAIEWPIELIEGVTSEDDLIISDKDSNLMSFKEYDDLAAEMVRRNKAGNGFNFFHFMIDLEGGPCVYKRLSGCGSGTEYLAVTPWGDLYPCHQFVGNEKFLMGNVHDGVVNTGLQEEFKCCNVYAKEKCRDCFARFYCSGGCAANAYNFHGDILKTYETGCELQKKRVECAIMIKAAMAEQED